MDTKRIFVLGNGFDLAHYLPTAYVHFMDAMMVVESCEEEKQLGFDDLFQKYISGECSNRDKDFFTKTRELYKTDDLRLSIDTVNDLQEKLINNGWFQHFKHHLTDVDTWIDFENEIENSLLSFDFIFNIDFNTSTISDNLNSMYPSTEPDVNIEKILDNEKIFDWRLLNQTGLKVNYFINLLKSFGVLKHVYGHITYEVENKSGRHLNYVRQESKRLTLKDYEVLEEYRERRISEHTTQTNIKKSFNNIVETKYLSRNSTVYTSFNEIEIYNKILKDLELFSKIFTIYINLVINQLKPTKPLDAFGNLKKEIDAVYTFNYSDTFERLYPNSLESQLNQVEVLSYAEETVEINLVN